MKSILLRLTQHDVLRNDLWTSSTFTPDHYHQFSDSERKELADNDVFEFGKKVLQYDFAEADTHLEVATVYGTTALRALSFFTLPLSNGVIKNSKSAYYDPTEQGSSSIMHKMEDVVGEILQHARTESPVFWNHVNRYVPSESVWCEDAKVSTSRPTLRNSFPHSRDFHDQTFNADQVNVKSIHDENFVGSLKCHCGWTNGSSCTTTKCVDSVCQSRQPCWSVDASFDKDWQDLCSRGSYISDDYF